MNRTARIIFGILVFVFGGVFIVMFLRQREDIEYEQKGKELIEKVEVFKSIHRRLPSNMGELGGEPMTIGPYYQKVDDSNYRVYFAMGFDESKVYYSGIGKWIDEH